MKITALMPVRNESWCLEASLRTALAWCDSVVVFLHACTDGSKEIATRLQKEYQGRILLAADSEDSWDEMSHRQKMLMMARAEYSPSHIAIIDADEILSANLVPHIRKFIAKITADQMLYFPGLNLRGSLGVYHGSGIWGNRTFAAVFMDSPDLGWSGDQFHHREPMGRGLSPAVLDAAELKSLGGGGIMHLWGASERRLTAKHALYKVTERLRWPDKDLGQIETLYNLWRHPMSGTPPWEYNLTHFAWWNPEIKALIDLDQVPWQEEEVRRLTKGREELFRGLNLFGLGSETLEKLENTCGNEGLTIPFASIMRPIFSLCHTTARLPDGWKEAAKAWIQLADHPEQIEYILSVDSGLITDDMLEVFNDFNGSHRIVENHGRHNSVDGWNAAAKVATGLFLINAADDLFPCEHWDTLLLEAIPDLNKPYVVDVAVGGIPGLLPFSMLTRPYYDILQEKYGYDGFFFPGYESVYSDTEFTTFARRDGVVLDCRHINFDHRHPIFGKAETDDVYRKQNAPVLYETGRSLYETRCKKFQSTPVLPKRFTIAVLLPGEHFSARWIFDPRAGLVTLLNDLQRKFNVLPLNTYSTNVYITRNAMWDAVLASPIRPHLVLWVDDDNLVSPQQIDQMLTDLNNDKELDGVFGWCFIQRGIAEGDKVRDLGWQPSCGRFDEKGIAQAFTYEDLALSKSPVVDCGWSGFPVALFRFEALEKIGQRPFSPIVDEKKFVWGFSPEDVSLGIRAREKGVRLAVDRRVEVEHLKLQSQQPPESARAVSNRPEEVSV